MGQRLCLYLPMLLVHALVLVSPVRADGPASINFESEILPLLKTRCFRCHDERKQTASFRLDVRSLAMKGGESGKPAIVPKHPDKSDLMRRVASSADDVRMPPDGERLTNEQIKTLRRWIEAGAPWPDSLAGEAIRGKGHWAFRPPEKSPPPATNRQGWARNDIDRFILARLEKEGLQPAAEADRLTLLRRASLDLVGLPPSAVDVAAFLADTSPRAYENAVERLLASPHYGERWARLWLDAARYADSDGFEKDKARFVWFFREWVINAFNRDLPYDRFLIEQIAGDLLPGAGQDQRVATGFLRNSMINEEGGVDPEQFRMEAMFDRMDAIGKGILGLTIQCAQCHNHKYDPLTQKDYYRLFAFLNNGHEANIAVYTPEEQMRRAELFRERAAVEDDLKHKSPDWRERMHAWEDRVLAAQPTWTTLRPSVDEISTGGQKYLPQEDGSFLALGYAPTKHTVKLTAKTADKQIKAFRLELLNDPNLPLGGPGRSTKGTGALTEFRVEAAPADGSGKAEKIRLVRAVADIEPAEAVLDAQFEDKSKRKRITGPASFAIDGKDETAWGVDIGPGRRNQPRQAVFLPGKPVGFPKGTVLTLFVTQNHGGWNSDDNQSCNLGRFRLSATEQDGADKELVPLDVLAILKRPRGERSAAEEAVVFRHFLRTVPEWSEASARVEALWKQHPEGSSQLALEERAKPRPTHMLKRGDFLKPGETVSPGVPEFLHPLPAGTKPDRLAFAKWLADRRSPTTARAFVNRVWQSYFGSGLVGTSEDLGTQAEAPSHPQLLDWLAVEFMERGWSVKDLHRLIVQSATYRQSSIVTPELLARDPYNRLLARGARFRVDAEVVRDIALAASGLLNPKVGGRSVFPPLPDFMLMPPVSYGPKIWPLEKDGERYRRALYTFRYRSLPYPVLQNFDAPNGDASCVRRTRSNTPLQALTTLNEPLFLDCARALAQRTLRDGGADDKSRLDYAFRRCLTRSPSQAEAEELLALLDKETQRFGRPGAKPLDLAASDPAQPLQLPKGVDAPRAAAWTVVARVLLNLDETITKE